MHPDKTIDRTIEFISSLNETDLDIGENLIESSVKIIKENE